MDRKVVYSAWNTLAEIDPPNRDTHMRNWSSLHASIGEIMSRPFHMSDLAEGQTAQRCIPSYVSATTCHLSRKPSSPRWN